MKAWRFSALLRQTFCVLAAALMAQSAQAQVQSNPNFEYGVDRPGGDYRSFELEFDAPGLCAGQCAQEAQCRAWTYVKPGVQGPKARCWLKSVVPPAVAGAAFAISGLARGSTSQPLTPPGPGVNVTGAWSWTANCPEGTFTGVFDFGPIAANGSFSGGGRNGGGALQGGVQGNKVDFVRSVGSLQQRWLGVVAPNRMEGSIDRPTEGKPSCSFFALR